jgi:FSR family fosmidomycin resistance protein-like MFS transporter
MQPYWSPRHLSEWGRRSSIRSRRASRGWPQAVRHGFAQSLFQVGGNTGSALGPLVAAAVIVPFGQKSVAWFGLAALLGIVLLLQVSRWYAARHAAVTARGARQPAVSTLSRNRVLGAIAVLLVLIFSKYFYVAGISSFYTFYLIDKFGLSIQSAQLHLFVFSFASALGTLVGGPLGDRIGRKPVIWFSILGVAPFALILPHADLFWTTALTIVIGLVFSSASRRSWSMRRTYAGKIGGVGRFFGFAFVWSHRRAALGIAGRPHEQRFVYQRSRTCSCSGNRAAIVCQDRSGQRRSEAGRSSHPIIRPPSIRARTRALPGEPAELQNVCDTSARRCARAVA